MKNNTSGPVLVVNSHLKDKGHSLEDKMCRFWTEKTNSVIEGSEKHYMYVSITVPLTEEKAADTICLLFTMLPFY